MTQQVLATIHSRGTSSTKQGLAWAGGSSVLGGLVFVTVAFAAEHILCALGSGHRPGDAYVGKVQDLSIMLAEAYVLIFLAARGISCAFSPRNVLASHILSQTIVAYAMFAATCGAWVPLLSLMSSSTIAAAVKGAIMLAVFPGSSLSLIGMGLLSAAIIYRFRGIRMWTHSEMVWLYFFILVLVMVLLVLIFTSQLAV